MKKISLFLFCLITIFSQAQTVPNCNSFYAQSGTILESSLGIPNTSTTSAVPNGGTGLAVGPSFGFPAPNPTFWTTSGGNYLYWNGTAWINSGHTVGNTSAVNPGGSKNYIYNIVGSTGQVYRYDGLGPGTLLATIPALAGGGPYDLVGDDQDNFYYLRANPPQALQVYDKFGVLVCSYSVTGLGISTAGGGFAIVGNTVTASNATGYYVGVISATTVNFTLTPSTLGSPGDFASCPLSLTFNTNITASPSASITCTNSLVTLNATPPSSISPVSYTWSGPGIVTSVNNATVQVNAPGLYSCTLSNASCPTRTATANFTVINGITPLTISVSPSNPTKCAGGSPVTLTASGATNYTWTPSATLSSSVGTSVNANPAVTTTYTVFGATGTCTGTAVITVSVVPNPTVVVTSGNQTVCAGSSANLSASGATSYTWNPGSLTGATVTVNPASTTVYTVTGSNGSCVSSGVTTTITVVPGPTINPTASPTIICRGSSSTLTAVGALSYTWQPIGLTGSSVVVSPTVSTTYTVFGTGASGCVANKTITLVVNPTPTIIVLPASPTICAGRSTTLNANGAISYTWFPGSISSVSLAVTPTVSTTYTVVGTIGACSSSTTILVTVIPSPTITASASPTSICSGNSATLTAGGAISYTWNPGAITLNPIVVTPTITTTYTVRGTNGTCASNTTLSLIVNPGPTVTATASPTSICSGSGSTVTLTAAGAISYTWNPGNIVLNPILVTPTTSTTYSVQGSNAFGCRNTTTINISIIATPTLTAISNPTAICVGSSATLTSSGATTYTWNPGAITGASVAVSPTVSTTYTVSGANGACTSTRTITLVVNPNPTLTATASPTAICSGNSTTLTASGAVSYTWNPGGSTGSTTTVSPVSTTVYTVTGANATGCRSTRTVTVNVTTTPTLNTTASPTAICVGSSATITATGATNYTWTPGGATTPSVVVTPTTSTTYTVRGANGACVSTRTITLIVNPNPTVTATASPTAICSGSSATLTAGGAVTYTWNPGGTTGATVAVTPTITTTYTLTGANATGCRNTRTVSVNVLSVPSLTVSSTATAVCIAQSATLIVGGANTFTWLPGGTNGTTTVVNPTATTVYTVQGTNSNGCVSSITTTLNVTPVPTIGITSTQTVICQAAPVSITLTATGATNYTWSPVSGTGSVVVTTPTTSTIYTVTGNNGACNTTATLSVLVINCNNTIFGLTKAASTPKFVNGDYEVTYTVTAVNTSTNNLTSIALDENLNNTFPLPTTYTIITSPSVTSMGSSLTINPMFDGSNYTSLTTPSASTLLAMKRDTIVFTVKVTPNGVFCPFKNTVVGYATQFGSSIVADSSNNGFNWDPDGDGNPTNNDTMTVVCFPELTLEIPTGFSPNGDGINDLFVIKGLNGRQVKLTVFNRWGNKVYENPEYDNSWDGNVNISAMKIGNNKLPQATYFYIVEFLDGETENVTGYVVLQY